VQSSRCWESRAISCYEFPTTGLRALASDESWVGTASDSVQREPESEDGAQKHGEHAE
jgi:hypothetical protein